MSFPNRNALWAASLVQELVRSGVQHACISPGSRSTPLALACVAQPGLEVHVHIDERASSFFALGIAKRTGVPPLLLCTSGTAAAHFFPAVIEASESGMPLIVLTADRPPEARDWGAAQTIDQVRLYGRYARWAVDLPVPEPTAPALQFLRQTGCRAVYEAVSRRGPIHLNVPFREPLPPQVVPGDVPESLPAELTGGRADGRPLLQLFPAVVAPPAAALGAAAKRLVENPRGVIAVGPLDATPRALALLTKLASVLGYPLLAEASSSLRDSSLPAHDLYLRHEPFTRAHTPALLLRLGHAFATRAMQRYTDSAKRTIALGTPELFVDPSHRAELMLTGDLEATLDGLLAAVAALGPKPERTWRASFERASQIAETALTAHLEASGGITELGAAHALWSELGRDVPLVVASSMPIRDLETVAQPGHGPALVIANRGVNGIDGTLSTALGVAEASPGKRAAVLIGDVATLHDLNGLLAAHRNELGLTVLLVNNDGGGIFSFLEVRQHAPADAFERLFGTAHGFQFKPGVEAFGGTFTLARNRSELKEKLRDALAHSGVNFVEVQTQRDENLADHQKLWAALQKAMEGQSWPSTA